MKYEWRIVFYFLLFTYIFTILSYFLRGEFIKVVNYFGIKISYLKFLLISEICTTLYFISWRNFRIRIRREIMFENPFLRPMARVLYNAVLTLFKHIFFLPVYILIGLSLVEVVVAMIISFLFIFFGFFFTIFIYSFSFILRGSDFKPLTWIISDFVFILIPPAYSIFQVIPKELSFVIHLFPPAILLEGARFLIILGNFSFFIKSLIEYSLFTIPWIFISLFSFKKLFEISRGRGLIRLG